VFVGHFDGGPAGDQLAGNEEADASGFDRFFSRFGLFGEPRPDLSAPGESDADPDTVLVHSSDLERPAEHLYGSRSHLDRHDGMLLQPRR